MPICMHICGAHICQQTCVHRHRRTDAHATLDLHLTPLLTHLGTSYTLPISTASHPVNPSLEGYVTANVPFAASNDSVVVTSSALDGESGTPSQEAPARGCCCSPLCGSITPLRSHNIIVAIDISLVHCRISCGCRRGVSRRPHARVGDRTHELVVLQQHRAARYATVSVYVDKYHHGRRWRR